MRRNRIIVNGVSVEVEGSNITVQGDSIYVDGRAVHSGLAGVVEIHWYDDLASLQTECSVVCRDIYGDVEAGNSIHCRSIPGRPSLPHGVNCNITAGNSIHF